MALSETASCGILLPVFRPKFRQSQIRALRVAGLLEPIGGEFAGYRRRSGEDDLAEHLRQTHRVLLTLAPWLGAGLDFAGDIHCVSCVADIGRKSTGKKPGLTRKGRGQRMKKHEVQAVKRQLQQLGVELRNFKKELLTARVEEIEQTIHKPAVRSHSGRRDMFLASLYQSKS